MAFDADALTERRRLKRRLAGWRAGAILLAVAAVLVALNAGGKGLRGLFGGAHVARITISGIILEDAKRDAALAALADDAETKAVLVHISSPGGSTFGGESLYIGLRRIAAKKPVVAIIDTLGASAAYMTAIAADRIYARESSITGSVGVLFQLAEFSKLMEKLGVKEETVKSGTLKAEPSPFAPMSDQARAYTQTLVDETFHWFIGLVGERRKLSDEQIKRISDGRIVLGRNALELGLIDQIGGEGEARTWLAEAKGVRRNLPIEDVTWGKLSTGWFDLVNEAFGKAVLPERLRLDGLISVWHPDR